MDAVRDALPNDEALLIEELVDALQSPLIERRVRLFAAATRELMEKYYRPLLRGLYVLSTQAFGRPPGKVPKTTGEFMYGCDVVWRPESGIAPLEFLDWAALQVRNGAAHPGSLAFDPVANQLVILKNEQRPEIRLTEEELRSQLFGLFARSRTMHLCMLDEMGALDQRVSMVPSELQWRLAASASRNGPHSS
jgi:hypothetical protein